ncbi:terminase large subunit domain-containing protein [Microbacterium sp. SMR1]|uniref:terminase large subunit domain-containing protein n=1 Tax=Microbacterium sp. SMR1 TaxID=1497340 RepID=UPI000DCB080E|nr:terminase large subunit [Microbacterium sp. SMR1]RAZ34831.1 hypothetical protein DO944_03135 [Microbacterium sp. SMR1]
MREFGAARYTAPLSDNFTSDWDRFEPIVLIVWREAFGIELDPWQRALLRAILETYPPGHARAGQLRYRSVVVSMGRQNGKTELGAILGLWGLLRQSNAFTVGLASSKEQADLIYARARKAITGNPTLAKRFRRSTGTRGLETHDGAIYRVAPATSAGLQGIPITTALVDELHILPRELWADVVNGMGGRPNTLVIGITTAGGDESELLKNLYETGDKAVAGDPTLERFGFFCWEAPESIVPTDDAKLLDYLKAANPALSGGRLDPETILADVRALSTAEILRYRLNRFTSGTEAFIDLAKWGECQRPWDSEWPTGTQPVIALDWSTGQQYATIAAAALDESGNAHTQLVATIVNPTLEGLTALCEELSFRYPTAFVMYSYRLRELGNELKRRGYPVSLYSPADIVRASNSFYARVARKTLRHAGDPLLTVQLPRTVSKPHGDSFIISASDSSTEIDAVMATVMAVHAAEVTPQQTASFF